MIGRASGCRFSSGYTACACSMSVAALSRSPVIARTFARIISACGTTVVRRLRPASAITRSRPATAPATSSSAASVRQPNRREVSSLAGASSAMAAVALACSASRPSDARIHAATPARSGFPHETGSSAVSRMPSSGVSAGASSAIQYNDVTASRSPPVHRTAVSVRRSRAASPRPHSWSAAASRTSAHSGGCGSSSILASRRSAATGATAYSATASSSSSSARPSGVTGSRSARRRYAVASAGCSPSTSSRATARSSGTTHDSPSGGAPTSRRATSDGSTAHWCPSLAARACRSSRSGIGMPSSTRDILMPAASSGLPGSVTSPAPASSSSARPSEIVRSSASTPIRSTGNNGPQTATTRSRPTTSAGSVRTVRVVKSASTSAATPATASALAPTGSRPSSAHRSSSGHNVAGRPPVWSCSAAANSSSPGMPNLSATSAETPSCPSGRNGTDVAPGSTARLASVTTATTIGTWTARPARFASQSSDSGSSRSASSTATSTGVRRASSTSAPMAAGPLSWRCSWDISSATAPPAPLTAGQPPAAVSTVTPARRARSTTWSSTAVRPAPRWPQISSSDDRPDASIRTDRSSTASAASRSTSVVAPPGLIAAAPRARRGSGHPASGRRSTDGSPPSAPSRTASRRSPGWSALSRRAPRPSARRW